MAFYIRQINITTNLISEKLQALPIRTAKAFLRTLAENKTNPYFDSGSQLLTLNNITRIVVQTCVPELTSYWLDWLKSNASSNPLLFDLVPAEVSSFEIVTKL